MLKRAADTLDAARRVGWGNSATVALYRARARSGLFARRLPIGAAYDGPIFVPGRNRRDPPNGAEANEIVAEAELLLGGEMRFFSGEPRRVGAPPNWHGAPATHWSRIGDFGPEDIKAVWEPSRFGWAPTLAMAFRLTGETRFLDALEAWTRDWIRANPLNAGPNWKCGQETSIRLMHVLLAAFLVGADAEPSPGLVRFVAEHCARIVPTLSYAMAQDNNHGTSEAAALFAGGIWLERRAGAEQRDKARRWVHLGRRRLEDRAARLIEPDGSFSQSSVNYHRMMLDTLGFAEFWRRHHEAGAFSDCFRERAQAATRWLFALTDPTSGDAPNLGANDGTRLFLSSGGYRDHRSSVQTAAVLFFGRRFYEPGRWDSPLHWLGVAVPDGPAEVRTSSVFPDAGYAVLVPEDGASWALVRFPRFRFRPSHADALHVDLWRDGRNLLRDSGTYSYNTSREWMDYFPGTAAHNTIVFDARDQMPRIGRFLFGEWLQCEGDDRVRMEAGRLVWSGGYTDYRGCRHDREVEYDAGSWRITDRVDGFRDSAALRWRLMPGDWQRTETGCRGEGVAISVTADRPIAQADLEEGWESRLYGEKSALPVFKAVVRQAPAIFVTTVTFEK